MKHKLRIAARPVTIGCVAATLGLSALAPSGNATADEPFQAQLRILDYNVFGFQVFDCERRARSFGHIVANAEPAYDVVGLNEYYADTAFDFRFSSQLVDLRPAG